MTEIHDTRTTADAIRRAADQIRHDGSSRMTEDAEWMLALADWLDAVDKDHRAEWTVTECPSCDSVPHAAHPDVLACSDCGDDYPCYSAADALKFARAYLGEPTQ